MHKGKSLTAERHVNGEEIQHVKSKTGDSNFDAKNSSSTIFASHSSPWRFYLLCCTIENHPFEDILASLAEIAADSLGWTLYSWWA